MIRHCTTQLPFLLHIRTKLRWGLLFVCAIGTLLSMVGCLRDDLCFFHPDGVHLLVRIDWDKYARVSPNAATILIYNADTKVLVREEILTTNRRQHLIKGLPVGKYAFVVLNETLNGSHFEQTIGYRDFRNMTDFQAFVLPSPVDTRYGAIGFQTYPPTRSTYTSPDTLSVDRNLLFEIKPEMLNILHIDPAPKRDDYKYPVADTIDFAPQRVISVVNVRLEGKNLNSIASYSCFLNGMTEAYWPAADLYASTPIMHPVVFTQVLRTRGPGGNLEVDALKSCFSVMGLQNNIAPESLTQENLYNVELRLVLNDQSIYLFNFDLIKEKRIHCLRKYTNGLPHDVININLYVELPDLPPIGGGGIITNIDDWYNQEVVLESTTVRFHPNQGSGSMTPIRRQINTQVPLPYCEFNPPTEPKDWTFRFKEWNTKNDGTGASYQPLSPIKMPRGGILLYAIWEPVNQGGSSKP